MACYIVTGIYGDDCLFTIALKTFVDWVEDNQENLSQSIVKYHLAMALAHDVSTFLGRYLNACVRDFCTTGLEVPGYKKKCSLEHIISDLSCGPYQGVTNLSPSLKDLLAHRDAQCVGWGLANPGGAEACHLHKVTERSMEESSNLRLGGRYGPIEGGVPQRQRRHLQQTQHQWRARDPPVPTREILLRTPKSSSSFGSSQEITPMISSKTSQP